MEVKSSVIETGVDKLVNIVKERGRIALQDAAKELGVSTTVIQEWVDFLEEEGIISVEYKLTKPYLVERKLTKKEVETKAKEFTSKKEIFVRKAEVSLSFLEKQAEELKKAKEEFDKLKEELGLNIESLKEELKELERYQHLKEELQKEAEEQRKEAQMKIEELTKEISRERRRYDEFVEGVKMEKEELAKEREVAKSIGESEKILNVRIADMKNLIAALGKKIYNEDLAIKNSEAHIEKLNQLVEDVKNRAEEEKTLVDTILEKSKEEERKILEIQNKILSRISNDQKKFTNAKDITNKFKIIFEKKLGAMNLIYKLNKDRDELETNLMELIKKARSFQLTMKKGDIGKDMLELEKKFIEVNKKRGTFEMELKKLTTLFRW